MCYLNADVPEAPLVLAEELLEGGEVRAAGRQAPAVVVVHLKHGPGKIKRIMNINCRSNKYTTERNDELNGYEM